MRTLHCWGGLLGAALWLVPVADGVARKKETAAETDASKATAAKPVTVVTTEKTDLRAEGDDLAKVLKHLKKKDKLEYVSRSADGKWVQVRKGKVEGWVSASVLEGVPATETNVTMAAVGAGGDKPAADAKAPAADAAKPTAGDTKTAAAKPPEKTPAPAITPAAPSPAPPPPPPPAVEPPAAVAAAPPVAAPPVKAEPMEPAVVAPLRDGLRGFTLSIGGGAALLNSAMRGSTSSGLVPELYNYHVDTLPGLSLQARVGYTYGHKWLRVGVDAGYRFAGGSTIVIQLPDRDSIPGQGQGGAATTVPLHTARQELAVTTHDADAGLSFGGYFRLPKRLEMSIRARGGLQVLGFIPEFNALTSLPQEIFYGPSVGGIIDFQMQSVPGVGVRLDGGYIPYALRLQNSGLRDAEHKQSTGYYVGAGVSGRILPGFEVELTYRLLSTTTTYQEGSTPERLGRDRDPEIQRLVKSGMETLASGTRETGQHSINVNLVFFRR
ncbi:MAG: hypothetical protein JNJ46_18835 [Myxococcales bacterium]|nr:hypothetical protein [Myxococcales bacterium]